MRMLNFMFKKLLNLVHNLMTVYIHVNFARDRENISFIVWLMGLQSLLLRSGIGSLRG